MGWEGNREWQWDQTDEVGLTRFVMFSKDSNAVADFINSARSQIETFEHDIDTAIAEGMLPPSGYDFHINTPQRRRLVEAIYNALSIEGLSYDRPNHALFSNPNQLIQLIPTPERLFHHRRGTCLDLSILFCAICWHYDLLPILILTKPSGDGGEGHAFVAVSLTHRGREWDKVNRKGQQIFKCKGLTNKSQDLSELKKGHYLAVECTGFAKSTTLSDDNFQRNCGGLLTFQQATELGRKKLDNAANNNTLKVAIDIAHSGYKKYWWNGLFSDLLKIENEKSSNPITTNNRPISELYVEPKLSKRPRTEHLLPTRQEDQVLPTTTEEATRPDGEVETKEIINYDTFLKQLCKPQSMEKSEGKRLAIIGEPGSGKTVLLLNFAEWILNQRGEFPILISLAKLNIKQLEKPHGLKEYLVNTWLPENAKKQTEECKEPFEELLKSGRVWLLLDGVNEMAAEDRNASYPLAKISDQLADKEVWGQVRVVVTCRLNEWEDRSNNLVRTFNTFRILNYKYPDDVNKFISNWFQDNQDKGNSLINKIVESDRLKDLAKNPLRLALLCYISGNSLRSQQLNLINKTTLYELAEEAYYARKKNDPSARFDLSDIQRCKLRNLLRNLSKSALEKESSPFCLDQKFLDYFFEREEHKDELVLLPLVKDFWLNNIGQSRKGQDIYTFFHPSFQEYFASQAIDDWDYFLPKEHTEDKAKIKKIPPQIPGGDYKPYRIFESKWKEVILLWMGREVDNAFRTKKEEFIRNLVKFQDGWENFYSYRAYFLAAELIAEVKDWEQSPFNFNKIVNRINRQVDEWRNGKFENPELGKIYYYPVSLGAIDVLAEEQRSKARNNLEDFKKSEKERRKCEAKQLWHKLEIGNQDLTDRERFVLRRVAECQVENWSELLGDAERIVQISLQLNADSPILWKAIERLGEIGENNSKAIEFLLSCILPDGNDNFWQNVRIAEHFNIEIDDVKAIDSLLSSIQPPKGKGSYIFWKAVYHLVQICPESEIDNKVRECFPNIPVKKVAKLVKNIYLAKEEDNANTQGRAEKKGIEDFLQELVGTLGTNHVDWFSKIVQNLKTYLQQPCQNSQDHRSDSLDYQQYREQYQKLYELDLLDYLFHEESDLERFRDCYQTVWYCAQRMSYPDFYEAWIK